MELGLQTASSFSSEKLYENERNWMEGVHVPGPHPHGSANALC